MLYLFDWDGTLVESCIRTGYDTAIPLPRAALYLRVLQERGNQIAIVSNQGDVGLGRVSEEQVMRRFKIGLDALGLPASTPIYVCFAHERASELRHRDPAQLARRKPSPAMLIEAMHDAQTTRGRTIYVGDRDVDHMAASDAWIRYRDVCDFYHASVRWKTKDGCAVRPSDGARFSVDVSKTNYGRALVKQLTPALGPEAAIQEAARQCRVTISKPYGEPDDDQPVGDVAITHEKKRHKDGHYMLSPVLGDLAAARAKRQ